MTSADHEKPEKRESSSGGSFFVRIWKKYLDKSIEKRYTIKEHLYEKTAQDSMPEKISTAVFV